MSLINQPAFFRSSWSAGDKICTSCLGRARGRRAWKFSQVCQDRSHRRSSCAAQKARSGNREAGLQAPGCISSQVLKAIRRDAACPGGKDWRLKPHAGS